MLGLRFARLQDEMPARSASPQTPDQPES